jgi:hypothetical protein
MLTKAVQPIINNNEPPYLITEMGGAPVRRIGCCAISGIIEMKLPDIEKPIVVGVTKACFMLDCGRDTLYKLIRANEIESFLQDDRRKVVVRSIDDFIARQLAAKSGEFQPPPNRKAA